MQNIFVNFLILTPVFKYQMVDVKASIGGMSWSKTDVAQYHANVGLPEKFLAIKVLIVFSMFDPVRFILLARFKSEMQQNKIF